MKQIPMEVRDFSFFQNFLAIFLAILVDFQPLLLLYSVWFGSVGFLFGLKLSKNADWKTKMASFRVLQLKMASFRVLQLKRHRFGCQNIFFFSQPSIPKRHRFGMWQFKTTSF